MEPPSAAQKWGRLDNPRLADLKSACRQTVANNIVWSIDGSVPPWREAAYSNSDSRAMSSGNPKLK